MKYRAIVNGVSFYTTTRAIQNGVGDFTKINDALRMAMVELDKLAKDGAIGFAGTWNGCQIQLTKIPKAA
jgi:hypothetical protein